MNNIRTFIALDIPPNIKKTIFNLYSPFLNEKIKKIKWVPKENLHLTLKFLGEINQQTLEKVIHNLLQIKLPEPVNLKLFSCGIFPNLKFPKVLWLSFEEKEKKILNSLVKKIETSMEQIGFKKEKRDFIPHLTIARVKLFNTRDIENFKKIFTKLKQKMEEKEFKYFSVSKLTLFKSTLTPKGSVYTIIKEFQ